MTTGSADFRPAHAPDGPVPIEELIRQQRVPAVRTVEDLATNDVFDSDEELAEFLAFVAEQRRANLV
ncbi:MAG: hypothetical protein ACRDTF_23900 [Pseudonocardiaceae bacterium]